MITCANCGNANSATQRVCQFCGAPLSSSPQWGERGFSQPPQSVQPGQSGQAGQQGQSAQASQSPALPAWLESLRSDIPARSPNSSPMSDATSFSAEDFTGEGGLPHWMQPDNEAREESRPGRSGISGQHAAQPLRASSFSAPDTDEGYRQNISAHDLIDEQMLPPWMRQGGMGSSGETNNATFEGQRNISASSLIQQDIMPDWMRNAPQSQSSPRSPASSQPPQSFQPPQAFSAHDLIDQQALPQWLQGNAGRQEQQGQQGQAGTSWNAAYQPQRTFSNEPQRNVEATEAANPSVFPDSSGGFSASSLLDMNSLPSWMRDAGQTPVFPTSPASFAPSAYPTSHQPGQAVPSMPPQAPPSQQGGLAASSFIDVNQLPDWLRAASEQGQPASGAAGAATSPSSTFPAPQGSYPYQGTSGQSGQSGQYGQYNSSYGGSSASSFSPSRPDSMRVPGRPRGDLGVNEGNEAAANAFASMLGVASHAPQFPQNGQPPRASSPSSPQYAQSASSAGQSAVNAAPAGQPAYVSPQNGQPPAYMNNIGVAQMPQMPQGAVPGAQSSQAAGPYATPGQPGQHTQSQGGQGQQGGQQMGNQEKLQKRGGLFEAIRNFFFR